MSATSAAAPERLDRFRVALRGYRITSYVEIVEGREVLHDSRPVEDHYRPKNPQLAIDEGVPDDWLTLAQLRDVDASGRFSSPPKTGFRKRRRVRNDLTTALFEGVVIEARDEDDAKARFKRRFGVRQTNESNWDVKPVAASERLGVFGPVKARGLLAQR